VGKIAGEEGRLDVVSSDAGKAWTIYSKMLRDAIFLPIESGTYFRSRRETFRLEGRETQSGARSSGTGAAVVTN